MPVRFTVEAGQTVLHKQKSQTGDKTGDVVARLYIGRSIAGYPGDAGKHLLPWNTDKQQTNVFRIMEMEKLIVFLFLTFILLIVCFNIIGSVSMLIIDKCRNRSMPTHSERINPPSIIAKSALKRA